jgi:cytochrome c nitrite reductase small subunit
MRIPVPLLARIAVAMLFGVAAGVGLFTFVYAKGASYMTNDPAACANCHIMQPHYDAWLKGSHHAVATCNDCHTPHNFFGKYWTKAVNGYNHSLAFTSGWFHEPIQITPRNRRVTQAACRHCHAEVVAAIDARHAPGDELDCIRCHATAGHMK